MGMTIDADRFKELLSESRERLAGNISDKVISIIRENYIPKADYENRLKADMVAMLIRLKNEIDDLRAYDDIETVDKCEEIIQDKINSLKEGVDGENNY